MTRPTLRPANQRYPQPTFVFPVKPPSKAELNPLVVRDEGEESHTGSLWTPTHSPSLPAQRFRDQYFSTTKSPSQASRHKRAHSHSTIDERHVPIYDSDIGAFKVVIERLGTAPKTAGYLHGIPTLEVPIPSYKLGTPRFSVRGTAFLRNSSNTATDDVRSTVSYAAASRISSYRPARKFSRRHSDECSQPHCPTIPPASPFDSQSLRSPGLLWQRTAITPEMFDALTFKPACDHPSVVRYSISGGIRAATPARLVAEITSPTFVDYDLLSDFFLTFRSFLETTDLLHMLIARLRWALARGDETGTVVRVRTFVAIRHWILNYFLDDYVVDWELRQSFCHLLNTFISEQDAVTAKVPLKILGELKKCWRRVCALYWDSPEFNTNLGPDVPILPGGVGGSRNPNLDPTFWETNRDVPPRLDGIIEPDFIQPNTSTVATRDFFADVSRAGHGDSMVPQSTIVPQGRQSPDDPPLSPDSTFSEDFVSCSFPSRGRAPEAGLPVKAHPLPASSIYDPAPPIANTPRALAGKRVRPSHAHKRSGSFSDSLREHRVPQQPVQKVLYKSTELLLALPYAGSLVRGNLFPPGQAFVEVVAPGTPADVSRATTRLPRTAAYQKGPSAMSGPGMKKLLGSVRRALSNRGSPSPNSSPTQGSFPHIPPLGVRGATINRLPGTAVVPQARPRNTGESHLRLDLLGAEVAEHFKKAVREDAEADAEMLQNSDQKSTRSSEHDPNLHYSIMRPDVTIQSSQPPDRKASVSEMTNGSKSIVFFDDTLPSDLLTMAGGLPANPSVDTFADAFMQPSGGPTPPSTPPEQPRGTPRRSSHLLGEHTRPLSPERTPSLVVDSRPSGDDDLSPSHRLLGITLAYSRGQSYQKSKKSTSLRRYASFQSGFTRHKSERSFDATTFSESEDVDHVSHSPSVPLPLRVLRRRPGGDLRAARNAGDLRSQHPLRRPMSTGSIATFSDSVQSSYLLGEAESSDYVNVVLSDRNQFQDNAARLSLGALAEPIPNRHVSLFSTHSSQPVMRPSFEKEAQMLAQIPDDADDDGGVESALLKLEGKFEQRQSGLMLGMPNFQAAHNSFGPGPFEVSTLTLGDEEEEKRRHRQKRIVEANLSKTPPLVEVYRPQPVQLTELEPAVYIPKGMQSPPTLTSPQSVESFNSVPLLEREINDDEMDRRRSRNWSDQSFLWDPSHERHHEHTPESSHPNSFDFINETDSLKRFAARDTKHSDESGDQSFLDIDSDDGSDLSSELSMEVISKSELPEHDAPSGQTFPPIRPGTVIKEMVLPSHPLRHPPSPPMTLVQALQMSPMKKEGDYREPQKHFPPTPQITPTIDQAAGDCGGEPATTPSMDPLRSHQISEPSRKTSIHLPFTLAFDSQILAQQFTLIEKDALNEIDWKDLIEMRWKNSPVDTRSWVDFLRSSDPHGVEVVIARFNLMVKWAISECVLTHDLRERVQCIIKYIHIAAHCREYRNFATMTQLTVALTSKDVARLTKTWAHVPAADMQTLKDLEALISPTSNFHSIRAEMEGSGADQGCIPFVGIYTHDLLMNSERPSQIASTPTTEPLVNFERCRTNASVIKNLLRLLEASQLYRFLPIEGVTERCLWMAALSNEEIDRCGKIIQT